LKEFGQDAQVKSFLGVEAAMLSSMVVTPETLKRDQRPRRDEVSC